MGGRRVGLASCFPTMQYRSHDQHTGGCIQKRGICVSRMYAYRRSLHLEGGRVCLPEGGGLELLELVGIYLIHAHVSKGAIE